MLPEKPEVRPSWAFLDTRTRDSFEQPVPGAGTHVVKRTARRAKRWPRPEKLTVQKHQQDGTAPRPAS